MGGPRLPVFTSLGVCVCVYFLFIYIFFYLFFFGGWDIARYVSLLETELHVCPLDNPNPLPIVHTCTEQMYFMSCTDAILLCHTIGWDPPIELLCT